MIKYYKQSGSVLEAIKSFTKFRIIGKVIGKHCYVVNGRLDEWKYNYIWNEWYSSLMFRLMSQKKKDKLWDIIKSGKIEEYISSKRKCNKLRNAKY